MTRAYVDASILIAAATARDPLLERAATAVLDDSSRTFVSSEFVRLEVLPKAVYQRRITEIDFYRDFFSAVVDWVESLGDVVSEANRVGERFGLNALDALHVASAVALNADEVVTTEGPTKPLHRVTLLRVVSIHPDAITTR